MDIDARIRFMPFSSCILNARHTWQGRLFGLKAGSPPLACPSMHGFPWAALTHVDALGWPVVCHAAAGGVLELLNSTAVDFIVERSRADLLGRYVHEGAG